MSSAEILRQALDTVLHERDECLRDLTVLAANVNALTKQLRDSEQELKRTRLDMESAQSQVRYLNTKRSEFEIHRQSIDQLEMKVSNLTDRLR